MHQHSFFLHSWIDRRRIELQDREQLAGNAPWRFGYAWDRVLVYGTAGGAGANVETALTGLPYQSSPVFGWTVGGGIEVAVAEHWTFKAEYLFVDLANYDVAAVVGPPVVNAVNGNYAVRLNENIFRVGLNFKYGH